MCTFLFEKEKIIFDKLMGFSSSEILSSPEPKVLGELIV